MKENQDYQLEIGWEIKKYISYLGLWKRIHNENFKRVEFDPFKNKAGSNK